MLLECLFCLSGVGCGDFRHSSTVLKTFEDVLGLFTVHGVLLRIRKNMVAMWLSRSFAIAVPVISRPRWKNVCFWLCLCLDHVEEARRQCFLVGGCSARCEGRLFFVPCQTKCVSVSFV